MVMSVERLYSRQCPKSISGDPSMFRKSANPMTGEDVLGILGQVQHREPLGAAVLDAQIAQDKNARAKLISAIKGSLSATGLSVQKSLALSDTAVGEVCDCAICQKCKGTGHVFSRKFSKYNECSQCAGVGRVIQSHKSLLKTINGKLPAQEKVTAEEWENSLYDVYMRAVDCLHFNATRAAGTARALLDNTAADQE